MNMTNDLTMNAIKLKGNDIDYPIVVSVDTFDNSIHILDEDSGLNLFQKPS